MRVFRCLSVQRLRVCENRFEHAQNGFLFAPAQMNIFSLFSRNARGRRYQNKSISEARYSVPVCDPMLFHW